VDLPEHEKPPRKVCEPERRLTLLAVGRLHAVKDHAFLVRACALLRDRGLDFECAIAGEGPERHRLESLIAQYQLEDRFSLLGHMLRDQLNRLYERADVVVLTSRSEGIPLVLMEAMVRGRIVIAPAITGIPEIVIPRKTGFLYAPGELEDLVAQILQIARLMREGRDLRARRLDWIRHAARVQVAHNFNRKKNLTRFAGQFLELVGNKRFATQDWSPAHEDFVLQQI
jgi:glycosyltransferase involved in cell wall biosynthesis